MNRRPNKELHRTNSFGAFGSLAPKKMSDPDLDVRYDLPDFLSKIPGLTDDGYDYGDDASIVELYMASTETIEERAVLEVARRHERWGRDVGGAIRISVR